MDCSIDYLPYETTGFFAKIVVDYLQQAEALQPFFEHEPTREGVRKSIEARKNFVTDRSLLVQSLNEQYKGIPLAEKVKTNIALLEKDHVFTVTTAHQPNIFTGPLYFIYKILHAVKLAEELGKQFPDNGFVPVYYMGSEDADLDELGYINVGGQKLVWQTPQTGAVGRMKVDKAFLLIIHAIEGQIAVLPYGNELISLFKKCYTEGKSIQQATLELVNELFESFGVVVVVPDSAALKSAFSKTITKELSEGFSHQLVEQTAAALSVNYKVQTAGRPVNLFYLIDDKRERIELEGDLYTVQALNISFTKEAMLTELREHPERFSPNVILRGVFQETILPNIVFIGGGGELAYWLELKNVFKAVNVPFPLLAIRNSFLFVEKDQHERVLKLKLNTTDLFTDTTALINAMVKAHSTNQLVLTAELAEANAFYEKLQALAGAIDHTLTDHVISLKSKSLKKLNDLEKKMLRAEKDKFETTIQQITQIKSALFPGNSLQERHDNFSLLYAKYGNDWIRTIYDSSEGLKQQFGIIYAS